MFKLLSLDLLQSYRIAFFMFTASSHGSLRTAATHRYKASLALAYKWVSRGQIGILVFNVPSIIASMCYNDFSLDFERPWFSSCTLATTASSPLRLRATESSQPLLRLDCSITDWFISWILIQKEVIIFFYHETLYFLTYLALSKSLDSDASRLPRPTIFAMQKIVVNTYLFEQSV